MNWRAILDAEVDALTGELEMLGGQFEADLAAIREKAATDADQLSLLVGQPGFSDAAHAAAINLGLFSSLKAVNAGDRLDASAREAWIRGMTTALRVTARIIIAL